MTHWLLSENVPLPATVLYKLKIHGKDSGYRCNLIRIQPVLNKIINSYNDISRHRDHEPDAWHRLHRPPMDMPSVRSIPGRDERGSLPEFGGRSICRILSEDIGINAAPGYGLATHLYNVRKGLVPAEQRLSARSGIISA